MQDGTSTQSRAEMVADQLGKEIAEGSVRGRLESTQALAERFGVAVATMHRALGKLKDRGDVYAVAGRGTYVNSRKHDRTHMLGVLLHDVPGGPMHHQLLSGIQGAAQDHGQTMLPKGHGGDPGVELELVRQFTEDDRVDGIIAWPTRGSYVVGLLVSQGVPLVVVPHPFESAVCTAVYADDSSAAMEVMLHLLTSGYRRIGFVQHVDPGENTAFGIRHQQYRRAMATAGLAEAPPIIIGPAGPGDPPVPPDLTERLREFDAVFCVNDAIAGKVVQCCVRNGIRVPDDLAVAGYDNSRVSQALGITSVEQHFDTVGREAVELLMKQVRSGNTSPVQRWVRSELIIRDSTTAE